MIFLYIYLIVFILLYVFLQLNYMFVWFKKFMYDDAGESLFLGLLPCIVWPIFILVCLLSRLASYMKDIHDKHRK